MKKFGIKNELLPGTVDKNIVFKGAQNKPFRNKTNVIKCGYFGGLTKDKGADFLIKMINESMDQNLSIKWYITGAGPYKDSIVKLSKDNPNFVEYLGVVSDLELAEIVSNTDILLNPHIQMNGVFPFKIIEYAASGRLILSSDILLPTQYDWIKKAILFETLDVEKWLSIITKSSNIYLEKKVNIDYAKKKISMDFSEHEIRNKILKSLKI
jgi:glycosyltransferase involved in cell wall biosynthesis